jgi:hypothetical protein
MQNFKNFLVEYRDQQFKKSLIKEQAQHDFSIQGRELGILKAVLRDIGASAKQKSFNFKEMVNKDRGSVVQMDQFYEYIGGYVSEKAYKSISQSGGSSMNIAGFLKGLKMQVNSALKKAVKAGNLQRSEFIPENHAASIANSILKRAMQTLRVYSREYPNETKSLFKKLSAISK